MHKGYYDSYLELLDFPGLANVAGKYVKIERINFSFYFSNKIEVPDSIRVNIIWNRDSMKGKTDGYMELFGAYKYTQNKTDSHISEIEIQEAKNFFKKYKILFAAAYELVLDVTEVQEYFSGRLSFEELKSLFEVEKVSAGIFDEAKSIEDLERIVRKNKLFDMHD